MELGYQRNLLASKSSVKIRPIHWVIVPRISRDTFFSFGYFRNRGGGLDAGYNVLFVSLGAVGTGTGYCGTLLAKLGCRGVAVVSMEQIEYWTIYGY